MLSLRLRSILILFVGVGPWYAWPVAYGGEETDALRTRLFAEARKRTERCWERYIGLDPPHDDTSARAVMSYALILAQANAHLERLPRLMELTEHMQQDDPESPDHGNLWWYWRDGEVTDPNSVEFVMQTATRLWTRHRTELEPTVVSSLHRVMTLGAQGCMQHQVPVWYTNIAILNASNLIALGEILEDPAVAEEGYRRLKDICLWTWKYGITEYVSPTYYAVNLDGLRWIAARADRAEGRRQAESMLNLLATDIGASWWPPAQRVAGAHSRSYDYLHGTGELDKRIALAGWTNETVRVGVHHADTLGDDWSLPAAARQLASRFPRRVRQRWGEGLTQTRSAYLLPDIALSIASAYYGRQDVPLAVDLPGDPSTVRCYFIADGRDDPYGAKRYATGQAGHRKALHLPYFWAGAQRGPDALGLVVYREEDLNEPERTGLKSHFVFRRNHDGLFVGDRQVTFGDEGRRQAPVLPGETVVVRYAAAAVGIRVLFARRRDGWAASTAVVDDGNSHGALRLSVDHDAIHDQGEQAAACFWVRIGSGLADDAAFARWRREFTAAQPHVHVTHKVPMERAQNELRWLRHFAIRAPGVEGPVGIDFSESLAGMYRVRTLDPSPTDAILEIDGQPVGRQILADLPLRPAVCGRGQDNACAEPAGSREILASKPRKGYVSAVWKRGVMPMPPAARS